HPKRARRPLGGVDVPDELLRHREDHRDGLELRQRHEAVRVRGVDDVAHVHEPEPHAPGERGGDARIAELDAGVGHGPRGPAGCAATGTGPPGPPRPPPPLPPPACPLPPPSSWWQPTAAAITAPRASTRQARPRLRFIVRSPGGRTRG